MTLQALLSGLEYQSPEVVEAIKSLPPDVQAVVADFRKDYLAAIANFKDASLSLFSWVLEAQSQLQMMKAYLETERMRIELGITGKPVTRSS